MSVLRNYIYTQLYHSQGKIRYIMEKIETMSPTEFHWVLGIGFIQLLSTCWKMAVYAFAFLCII